MLVGNRGAIQYLKVLKNCCERQFEKKAFIDCL
jgi:hypothetical protein